MNSLSTVRRIPGMEFSRLDDAYLAIDAAQGYCYSLNGTAGRVWELTDQPTTLACLCLRLKAEYAVEEEICRRDVFALVNSLRDAGLLQITDGSE